MFFHLFIFLLLLHCHFCVDPCLKINEAFRNVANEDKNPKSACHCLPLGSIGTPTNKEIQTNFTDPSEIWIGCTRQQSKGAINGALNALNVTEISRLTIWSSVFDRLKNETFFKVRPRELIIEDSRMDNITLGAFKNVSNVLESLSLRANNFKSLRSDMFPYLEKLKSLDLSGNELVRLHKNETAFGNLINLERLLLNDNIISEIEEGVFLHLANLKRLNLANNKLKNITRDTFKGLKTVEYIDLSGNEISCIDPHAFDFTINLKIISLGSNLLKTIKISNLPNMNQIFLNDNKLTQEGLHLNNLTKLGLLNLDRNNITAITEEKMRDFSTPNLISLSLAENNLSEIDCHSFKYARDLKILSLQQNNITSLSCGSTDGSLLTQSLFMPLKKLKRLFLSYNRIERVLHRDINVLSSLKELALDHNSLEEITVDAFEGLRLRKLFLNSNNLYYLPKGLFDGWNITDIVAVDLSDNKWNCICGHEWIGDWLVKIGHAHQPVGSLGCLNSCNNLQKYPEIERVDADGHNFWIVFAACLLTVSTVLFLIIAGYLYFKENCRSFHSFSLEADKVRLIQSQESLLYFPNLPNNNSGDIVKRVPPPPIQAPISIIASPSIKNGCVKQTMSSEKKRVRFGDDS